MEKVVSGKMNKEECEGKLFSDSIPLSEHIVSSSAIVSEGG